MEECRGARERYKVRGKEKRVVKDMAVRVGIMVERV